jgi:hypothetical protein
MPDPVTAERIAAIAAAAGVPVDTATADRVARALAPTVARLADVRRGLAFELEPSTFTVVQQRELKR